MAFQLKKISLHELEAFLQSAIYENAEVIPISKSRVQSYVNILRAAKDDFALYLLLDAQKIIGFRTLFADSANSLGKKIQFDWLSGSWVHPEHCRKGVPANCFRRFIMIGLVAFLYHLGS